MELYIPIVFWIIALLFIVLFIWLGSTNSIEVKREGKIDGWLEEGRIFEFNGESLKVSPYNHRCCEGCFFEKCDCGKILDERMRPNCSVPYDRLNCIFQKVDKSYVSPERKTNVDSKEVKYISITHSPQPKVVNGNPKPISKFRKLIIVLTNIF